MNQVFSNNAVTALVGSVGGSDNIMTVANGSAFPALSSGSFFLATLIEPNANGNEVAWEIIKVIDRNGNTLSVVRGQEGTAARAWPDGAVIEARLTAGTLAAKAPLDSPAFTGMPTAPTPAAGTNTKQVANTAFVQAALAALVDSSPAALDTLNELAAALGDDPNFAATMATALGGKVDKIEGRSLSTNDLTNALLGKLNGIETGATSNDTNAQLRDRTTHTGEQVISTVTGLQAELEAKVRQSSATGAAIIPVGTGAQRPAWPSNGMLRYNATIEQFEGYQNGKWNSIGEVGQGGFRLLKTTSAIPAWEKSGAGLITAQALTYTLDGTTHELPAGTAISLPALTAGNDYAIYATTDGRLVADLNWSAPSGEPAGTTRKIGGFHVALTGEIFEYSLWDINYRPTCPDPRGMVCINGMFWADIYLLGVNHHIDGTSRAGVTIADGASPPKIPAIYGGNGSTAYGSLTWFETQDVLQSHGKRCPSWAEFSMLAFGVTEATAVGADPVTTKHDAPRRSRWGVEQATGNLWVWGADTYGSGAGWAAITGGRGSVHAAGCTAVLLGADWDNGANSGSRAADWNSSPSNSSGYVGGRGLSDHLRLLAER